MAGAHRYALLGQTFKAIKELKEVRGSTAKEIRNFLKSNGTKSTVKGNSGELQIKKVLKSAENLGILKRERTRFKLNLQQGRLLGKALSAFGVSGIRTACMRKTRRRKSSSKCGKKRHSRRRRRSSGKKCGKSRRRRRRSSSRRKKCGKKSRRRRSKKRGCAKKSRRRRSKKRGCGKKSRRRRSKKLVCTKKSRRRRSKKRGCAKKSRKRRSRKRGGCGKKPKLTC